MFAVIKTGGKQYRVQKGDVFEVEKHVSHLAEFRSAKLKVVHQTYHCSEAELPGRV